MPKITITPGKNATLAIAGLPGLATQHQASNIAALLDGTGSASAIAPSATGHQLVAFTVTDGSTRIVDLSTITSVTGS